MRLSDQARSRISVKETTRWPVRTVVCVVVALLVSIVAIVAIVAPSLFDGQVLRREVGRQVRLTTGLSLTAKGPARFALLPQPHVSLTGVHIADPSDTLTIDAAAMRGEVRLLPLLVGRIEMSALTLDRPQLVIDLDGRPMPADSMIGRALHATGARGETGTQRLGAVTLLDGTASLKSKVRPVDTIINAINVTVDWRNLDAPATATGTVEFKDVPADVAAWVAQPSSLLRGDHSPVALRVQSIPLDLSANGDIVGQPSLRFHGRVSANAPTLAAVLALAGYDTALPVPFANLVMSSEATVGGGALDLPSLRLRMDGNEYEGTLAFLAKGEKASLAGTLATEHLSLAPFLDNTPPLLDDARRWSGRGFQIASHDHLDLDLRISASHLRIPPLAIEDAALAVMTRDGRTEITLVDGRGYGGTIKGRASMGTSDTGLSLRAGVSLADVDAGAFSWDLFGRQMAAGTLTASASLESSGDSIQALMTNLNGWVKARAQDGEIADVDFGHGLREIARQRFDSVSSALRSGHTSFESFAVGARIADGIAMIEDGSLLGQDATMQLGGRANISQRTLDLTATAIAPDGDGAASPSSLRLGIKGTFDQPSVLPVLQTLSPAQTSKP